MATLAQTNWTTAPLIFWYNGGPGCSSMVGLMQEHGPYIFKEGKTEFERNPWAWNREANVFYVDAPSTTGFSICNVNRTANERCIYDDAITAQENLVALAEILKKFPDIQKNDLYLAGEEYAGIWVPELAKKVEEWNANCTVSKDCAVEPNLKGFIVGNGYTDPKYDRIDNAMDMAYWFGLIDSKLFELLKIDGCSFVIP